MFCSTFRSASIELSYGFAGSDSTIYLVNSEEYPAFMPSLELQSANLQARSELIKTAILKVS